MRKEKIYATRDMHGGLDWRSISRVMRLGNDKLSPSRARGLFLQAMEKFAYQVLKRVKGKASTKEIIELSQDPKFQQSIGFILRAAFGENHERR